MLQGSGLKLDLPVAIASLRISEGMLHHLLEIFGGEGFELE
jgi:hypothetical protein